MEGDGRCVADNPAWWRRARELVFLQGDGAGEVEGACRVGKTAECPQEEPTGETPKEELTEAALFYFSHASSI